MKTVLYILLLVFTSSCGFNKVFLVPTKISTSQIPFKTVYNKKADTLVIEDREKYQPYFINTENEILDYPYTIESKVFDSKSGNKLNAWIITNDSVYNGRNIIFFHGNAGNLVSQHKMMIPFVKAGYKVFMADYSGFGFSTGKATRNNVLLDGNSAIAYFTSLDTDKNHQWIIYGQSLGGHLTPVVALANEQLIDGILVEGAFTSHQDIGANSAGFIARLLIAEKYSAKKAIQQFKKPVLIIHSTHDEIIPYAMGEKLFELASQPKQFYQVDKCHICGPIYYSENILKKMDELFGK
ncbi:MAG: alpha/beta hydrolase [Flavobacteriales bacterium]